LSSLLLVVDLHKEPEPLHRLFQRILVSSKPGLVFRIIALLTLHAISTARPLNKYHGGVVLWSSRKVREARTRRSLLQQAEVDEKLEKARMRKEQEDKKIQKQLELEQRRVEREGLKMEREKEKEKKAQKVALR
jgi:hypothetical protein